MSLIQEVKLQDMSIVLKTILDSKRKSFKTFNLTKTSGLDGRLIGHILTDLTRGGYLREDDGSAHRRYYVTDLGNLKTYYEELKAKLPKDFVDYVLSE